MDKRKKKRLESKGYNVGTVVEKGPGALGHRVGLEVHEWPFVGYQHMKDDDAYRDTVLEENMVISMEPMMFLPDAGDFQIEDQFVVTKTGGASLNDIPHKIFEV